MPNEEQLQEAETLETSDAETQAAAEEEEKNFKAEAAKWKAIAERKSKQLEKIALSLKEKEKMEETNKTNTHEGLSKDEVKLYAMGYSDEEVELAAKLSKLNGLTIAEAVKDDYFQAKVRERKDKEISDKAQIGPANGGAIFSQEEPDDREAHQKWYLDQMKKAGLS